MTAWAKAPPHSDPIGTLADEHEYLNTGLVPVSCAVCATEVLVRKASRAQTSVQYQSSPATSCPEFAARVADGELSARIDTCPRLRESIERAVVTGAVAVPDE
ncbi:hypothetical protein [Actinophytocola oryzae]|uniref:Ferredoxin n=1 Tax=Actinophytocola oryzae TaxID=502181 RepID=A0A4R7VRM3_9PSEU|nr:hypothetical protein [Actinophytocola oryzae]TDV52384.1 hypothetical protein CLV71_105516 [Actinophytocola oryzae]